MRRCHAPMTLAAGLVAAALAGGCAADTDERPAEFAYIATTILKPSCATATCHSAMTRREGLDFSSVEASAVSLEEGALVPVGGAADPYDTQLMFVLSTSGERRMPVDAPLPDADLDLIAAWIAAGAVR